MTAEQYELLEAQGEDISETLYLILPEDPKYQTEEAIFVNQQQKGDLLDAAKIIENYCEKSDKTFENYEEKLEYVSRLLPPVFTNDSKFKMNCLRLAVSQKQG